MVHLASDKAGPVRFQKMLVILYEPNEGMTLQDDLSKRQFFLNSKLLKAPYYQESFLSELMILDQWVVGSLRKQLAFVMFRKIVGIGVDIVVHAVKALIPEKNLADPSLRLHR